ncbi:c-type cytochrome [Erythrobacter sp. R86502]|uniref:c-type cytochrome n=1 Tax=Erythrobacter sp. R86502 TaxID=3093846 RepID=UPI0036D31C23
MPRKSVNRMTIAAVLTFALIACSGDGAGTSSAGGTVPPIISERHDNFEAIGAAFKTVRVELEKDAPKYAVIAAKATDINTRAMKIENHFPAGTSVEDGFKTEALPAIWETPEEFKAAAQKLVAESAKLAAIAGGGDKAAIEAQAKVMGGTCKSCHDKFRLDNDK